MPDHAITASSPDDPIPADDLDRRLTIAQPDDPAGQHISLAGNVYTILIHGEQSDGRYCLIDMLVPDGGGPPPHRHDFEEMFTLLDGEIQLTFRGETLTLSAPATVNIPANAPHSFKNVSGRSVHMLCMCTPAGQDAYFLSVADPLASRTSSPPDLDAAERAERGKKARALAPRYRTEFVD
jgi:quercetin dioxygenase-like cupin family protein